MADLTDVDEGQAAGLLRCSTKTLQRYRRSGLIGFHRTPGGRIRYTFDQLADFVARGRVQPRSVLICPALSPYVQSGALPKPR